MPIKLFDPFPVRSEDDKKKDELVEIRPQPDLIVPDAPKTKLADPFPVVTKTKTKFVPEKPVEVFTPPKSFGEVAERTFNPEHGTPIILDLADPELNYAELSDKYQADIANGIVEGFTLLQLRATEGLNDAFSWMYSKASVSVNGKILDATQKTRLMALQQTAISKSMDAEQQFDELVNSPDTPALQRVASTVVRFTVPFLLFRKVVGAGTIMSTLVTGPLADIAAFTDDEERLSSLIADAEIPGLSDAVGKYLTTDPDDTKAQAVFKQYLEGAMLGVASDGALLVLGKVWAAARSLRPRKAAETAGVIPETEALPGSKSTGSILEEADSRAATVAQEFLSTKVKLKPGDDPAEVVTNLFKAKLQTDGVWDMLGKADQDAKLLWMFRRAEEVFGSNGKLLAPATPVTKEGVDQWRKGWDQNVTKAKAVHKKNAAITPKKIFEALEKKIWDRSGPLRRMLNATPEGEKAAEMFALSQGASTKAVMVIEEAIRTIYREKIPGLPVWRAVSREKRGMIDMVINIRRFRQVKGYNPKWSEKGNELSRKSTEFYDELLKDLRLEIGEAEFQNVMKRADQFFTSTWKVLDELLDGGLLTNEAYKALHRFKFSPIKYIDELDQPIAKYIDTSGKPISVSSSGLQPLGKAAKELIDSNTEAFLQEIIVRSTGRSLRNRANLALREAAKSDQLIGVKLKIPKGDSAKNWTEIEVMEKGEPKKMFILNEYAPMWAADPEETSKFARGLGYAMGTPLVRLGATGPLNPEFAISNFPRDVQYNILVSNQYSGFLPKAVKEWGEDFADVWEDAVFQKGTYKDYINEGGGMEFLTHQGIPGYGSVGSSIGKDVLDMMSYTNTTSEIINRLTTRARTLKNIQKEHGPDYILTQADKEHATFVARTTLDFDQGGTAVKSLNNISPYLSPAVQGMRGYARSFKTNPAKASLYAAQLMGIYGAMYAASEVVNPEAHAAIPDYVSSLFITYSTAYSFVDDQGDTRYLYYKIPIDHSTTGLKIFADSLMRASMNKGLPSEKKVNNIKEFGSFMSSQFGIVPGATMPPVIGGLIAYGGNYDWWRSAPAWMGEQGIPARTEFTEETPVFFRDIANAAEGIADLSPARMNAAIKQVMPTNIFTDIMGMGYRAATKGIERDLLEPMEKDMIQKLKEFPGARRFIGITSPHGRFADGIREAGAEARGPQVQITRQIDAFSERIFKKEQGVTMETAANWIKQEVPFEQQAQAIERLVNNVALEEVFKQIKYQENRIHLPTRRWWKQVSALPPAARAALLVEHISAMQNIDGDVERREAKQIIGAVMQTVPGFNPKRSPEFAIGLKRELELQGIPPSEFFK